MKNSIDAKRTLVLLKGDERMVAFAGFRLGAAEGVMKVASFVRGDGGYLTLTFLIDTQGDSDVRDKLAATFRPLAEGVLQRQLEKDVTMVVSVPLDVLGDVSDYFIEELNIYIRGLEGRERRLLERQILPLVEAVTHATFAPLEWMPEQGTEPATSWLDSLRKWFSD
jgi:hypothetical protein